MSAVFRSYIYPGIKNFGFADLTWTFTWITPLKSSAPVFVIVTWYTLFRLSDETGVHKNSISFSEHEPYCSESPFFLIRQTIDKSFSRNELNEKIKNNQNTLLKSCFLNKNNNLEKKNFFIFEDIDKTNFTNKNYINKFSILNSNENNLIKNKIKKRADLNSSKNGPKRTKISLKMPMINNINKI